MYNHRRNIQWHITRLRPQPTRRTSWKLVGNRGFQLVRLVGCGL